VATPRSPTRIPSFKRSPRQRHLAAADAPTWRVGPVTCRSSHLLPIHSSAAEIIECFKTETIERRRIFERSENGHQGRGVCTGCRRQIAQMSSRAAPIKTKEMSNFDIQSPSVKQSVSSILGAEIMGRRSNDCRPTILSDAPFGDVRSCRQHLVPGRQHLVRKKSPNESMARRPTGASGEAAFTRTEITLGLVNIYFVYSSSSVTQSIRAEITSATKKIRGHTAAVLKLK
jgi:hypothetical protein